MLTLFLITSGETLTITASGTFHETIEEGAVVNVEVKWGVITLVKQTMDLCEQIENVDLKCPLEKGKMVLTKQVDLPKQIPPVNSPRSRQCTCIIQEMLTDFSQGHYSVLADVYTEDNRKVTCLKAEVDFKVKF